MLARIPLGRFGVPSDVADAVVLLASDAVGDGQRRRDPAGRRLHRRLTAPPAGAHGSSYRKGTTMPELQAIAHYTIRAGDEEEVLALVQRMVEASRAEPGNLSFDAYRRLDDGRKVVLLERYASREAFEAHRDTPHFRTYVLEQLVPRLESRSVEVFDVP